MHCKDSDDTLVQLSKAETLKTLRNDVTNRNHPVGKVIERK